MEPESSHQRFLKIFLSVGNGFSYLYCLQPIYKRAELAVTVEQDWSGDWSGRLWQLSHQSWLLSWGWFILTQTPSSTRSQPSQHLSQYGPHHLQARHLHFLFSIIFPVLYLKSKLFSTLKALPSHCLILDDDIRGSRKSPSLHPSVCFLGDEKLLSSRSTLWQSVSQSEFVNHFWEKYLILPCGSIRSLWNPIRTILSSTTPTQEHKDRSGLDRFRALS